MLTPWMDAGKAI